MKIHRRILALLMTAALCLCLCPAAFADSPVTVATILFTHDMHSHLLPAQDETGTSYGGYARLLSAIEVQKSLYPDALLVDGGDFSMGSLFQTTYSATASELRVMGALGYDATTFGNHEYDYRASGLAKMLNAAAASGDPLPAIVEANYLPPAEGEEGYGEDARAVWDAFENYGVEDYVLIQRGGIWYAVFGIMGEDSDECAPMSGMVLHDRFEVAQTVVDAARAECYEIYGVQPLVVCLSHSGTRDGKGEDYDLAKKVTGIDLIVSGHTHTTLAEPIQVGGTWIVSAGEYSKNLGVVTMDYSPDGTVALTGYKLIPIDDSLPGNAQINELVETYKEEVEANYLSLFGLEFDQVITHNPYLFDSVDQVYATSHESTLGNLFSDAYKWAAEQANGVKVDIALTASGVIRESIPEGDVTVSQVFNAASLGIGADEIPGYPLVEVYITGADVKNLLEVDASVYPIMSAAQIFPSGVEYSFNTSRMIFNKVDYAALRLEDGTTAEIQDDQLYCIVTGLYCGQMLGAVESKSFGLLSVTPRDADGNIIDMANLEDYIIHDENGNEVKEWHAIAMYLGNMGGEIDEEYSRPDGRKQVYSSLSPVKMLRGANKFTYIAIAVILVLILVIVLIVRCIIRRIKRRRKNK